MLQIRQFFVLLVLVFSSFVAFTQPATVVVDEIRNPCGTSLNGSIRITITSGAGPFTYFLIGFNTPIVLTGNLNLGVPFTVTGLPADDYLLVISDNDPGPNFQQSFSLTSTPAISGSVDVGFPVNNTNCLSPNGAISVSITGGIAPYTYSWTGPSGFTSTSEDIINLAGGDYFLNVTDAGSNCSFLLGPIKITDPEPTLQSITNPGVQRICVGNNAIINLSGSEVTAVYEVLVNGLSVGLPPVNGTGAPLSIVVPSGFFSDGDALVVEARTGICTPLLMTGVVITDIVALTASNVVTPNSSCVSFNGSIVLTVNGSVGPFTYQWSSPNGYTNNTKDISNLEHGDYTVIITDVPSGCSLTTTITVPDNRPILFTDNLSFTDVTCFGGQDGSINLSVSGASGSISYSISPDINLVGPSASGNFINLSAGNYTVRATDTGSGCFIEVSVTLGQPPAPTVDAGPDQTICEGSVVNLNGIIGGSATGAIWSGGSGVFTPDNTTLSVIYTPGTLDITNGSVLLINNTRSGWPGALHGCTRSIDHNHFTGYKC